MNRIILEKNDRHFLEGHFFVIKKGKIISREILETGKVITNENCIKEGEIVGNFFDILTKEDNLMPEIEIEVEALEDNCILEEFKLPKEIFNNVTFQKILYQVLKKSMIKFFYDLYDAKGYILIILKFYLNKEGYIPKKEIRYKNFNMSKSKFYLLYTKLKEEKFICERNTKIYINLDKTDKYLKQFIEEDTIEE